MQPAKEKHINIYVLKLLKTEQNKRRRRETTQKKTAQ